MNILLIGRLYPDTFTRHINDTLLLMGHNVTIFQPGLKIIYSNSNFVKSLLVLRSATYNAVSKFQFINKFESNQLVEIIKKNKIELTIAAHDLLTPDHVAAIKKITKSPVVIWFPDALVNFRKSMFLNAEYDFLFFKDPYVVEYLKNILLKNSYYLPECCNPVYHKPVNLTEEDKSLFKCDITTAGNLYPNRAAFFTNLTKYDVKIWGNPAPLWMNTSKIKKMIMNRYVSNGDKAKAFLAAKIVLNNLHPGEIWGVNCRAFEIPACGGFQIINYRRGLRQLFEIDKEVVAFNNYNELIEKIEYYLINETERNTIAEAGKIRTNKDHTYEKRLKLLIDTVFENKKGFEFAPSDY